MHFHPFGPTVQVASVGEGKASVMGIEWSGTDLSGFTGPYAWSA